MQLFHPLHEIICMVLDNLNSPFFIIYQYKKIRLLAITQKMFLLHVLNSTHGINFIR